MVDFEKLTIKKEDVFHSLKISFGSSLGLLGCDTM